MDAKTTKRKPGRPKKNEHVRLDVIGIVENPDISKDNLVELSYQNPLLFKKIFTLLKAQSANEIVLQFTKNTINLITQDHLQKSTDYVTIHGNKLNRYYCHEEIVVGIKRDNIQQFFNAIDKDYIELIIEIHKSSDVKIIKFTGKTIETGSDDVHYDKIFQIPIDKFRGNVNINDYAVRFILPAKKLKCLISEQMKHSPDITFQKSPERPLEIKHPVNHDKRSFSQLFNDNNLICLETNLENPEDDIVCTTVFKSYIQTFASTIISDKVKIAFSNDKPIVFHYNLDDGVCEINIITDIQIGG